MLINRNNYPELNYLLWYYTQQMVTPAHAFDTYERRWAHIDKNRLTEEEQALIEQLTRDEGNNILLVAS